MSVRSNRTTNAEAPLNETKTKQTVQMAALQFSDSFISELSRNTFVPIIIVLYTGVVVDEDTNRNLLVVKAMVGQRDSQAKVRF